MPDPQRALRDFIYLDRQRLFSLASQLNVSAEIGDDARADQWERLFIEAEPLLLARPRALEIDSSFDCEFRCFYKYFRTVVVQAEDETTLQGDAMLVQAFHHQEEFFRTVKSFM